MFQELEQLESDWRAELQQLTDVVERLTKENSKLSLVLKNSPEIEQKELIGENDSQMNRLQESLSDRASLSANMLKAKEELRQRERELEEALINLEKASSVLMKR